MYPRRVPVLAYTAVFLALWAASTLLLSACHGSDADHP